jgi:hypothetical protein
LPCNTLLDEASAQIGVDQASFRPLNSLTQALVGNPLTSGKPCQPFGFEAPHFVILTL